MDPRALLEHLSSCPPQPFSGGCAKLAHLPFLRSLQIVGAYHEHDYYLEFIKTWKESRHYMNVVENHNNDNLRIYTASEKTHSPYIADPVSHSPLFTRRQPNINGGHVITANDKSTDFRRRDNLYNNMASNLKESKYAQNNDIVTINIKDANYDLLSGASYPHPDHFLSSCGIIDTHLTSKMISSLGYDLTNIDGLTKETQSKGSNSHSTGFRLKSLWSDRTYAFLFVILHWANLFRCVMYLDHDYHVDLMTALIPVLWYALVASCNTCMFVSCVRRDHFYLFYCKWTAIYKDMTTRRLGLRGVHNTRFIFIVVIIHWTVALINLACVVFLMVMDDSFSAGMNIFFYITGYRSTTVIVISSIFTFFTSATWLGTTGFIIIMSHHVESHFREFSQVLQLHIAAAGKDFPPSLNLLRERHLAMCDSISVLDRYMKFTVGISFSFFVSVSCVLIYLLVRVPMDRSVMGITIMWLVSCLLLTGLPTYYMSNVNIAMHGVGEDLLTLQTRNMTLEQFGQLQMFLAKANGPGMGFSVLGLTVVTRELLLTLFGIYLTYGIVLLQFP